jgi:hypothetical protein
MSYKIIPNIKTNQFGIVFKIDKLKGFRGARINKIVCQNNPSQLSYNNNAIRFLRLGLDYRNKPLKYLYKGTYDKNKAYYLLNQIFLPPKYNYSTIQDYEEQLNEIIYNTPLSSSTSINRNIHLEYDSANNYYRLTTENMPGTNNIPNWQNMVTGITVKLRFKRNWKTESDYCPCMRTDSNIMCLCDKTAELNCTNNQVIPNTYFNIIQGDTITEIGTDVTVIFMNLNNTRLPMINQNVVNYSTPIQLQNGDQLLIISNVNSNTSLTDDISSTTKINGESYTQTLLSINNLDQEYYITPKEYYMCKHCMNCHCGNRYKISEGVYSMHYMIPKTVTINGENQTIYDEMDVYVKDCSSTYESSNGQNVMKVWNKNFDFVVKPNSFRYIIKKENIKLCCDSNRINTYGTTKYWQNGKQVDISELNRQEPYQKSTINTINSSKLPSNTDYVITGWEMDINNMYIIGNGFGELYKSSAISDLAWAKKRYGDLEPKGEQLFHTQVHNPIKYITNFVNDSGVLVSQTLYTNARVSYVVLKGPQIITPNSNGTYTTGNVYNPFPHMWITNWKTSPVLFDQLFYNTYMNNDTFIVSSNHYNYYFPIPITPIEFTTNIKAGTDVDFKTLTFEGENHNVDNRYYGSLLPSTLRKKDNLFDAITNKTGSDLVDNFELKTSDYITYLQRFLVTDKYYSLFGQLQTSTWRKLGIICNYIDENKLHYSLDEGLNAEWYNDQNITTRIYSMLGNCFTQELYLHDEYIINERLFNQEQKICRDNISLFNPNENIFKEISTCQEANDPSVLYKDYPYKNAVQIDNKDFKLYTHGNTLLTKIFTPMLYPTINYNDSIYLLKISFDEKIDYIINNHLDETEIQKNNIKFVDVKQNDINYNLEFKNLLYTFDETTSNSIWIYLDSQYHYPFIQGSSAHIEIEYIPE